MDAGRGEATMCVVFPRVRIYTLLSEYDVCMGGISTLEGIIQAGLCSLAVEKSREARDRRVPRPPLDPLPTIEGTPLMPPTPSTISTSVTAESAIRMIPAFLSNVTKIAVCAPYVATTGVRGLSEGMRLW